MVHVLGKAKASALPQSTRIGLNTKIKLVAGITYGSSGKTPQPIISQFLAVLATSHVFSLEQGHFPLT